MKRQTPCAVAFPVLVFILLLGQDVQAAKAKSSPPPASPSPPPLPTRPPNRRNRPPPPSSPLANEREDSPPLPSPSFSSSPSPSPSPSPSFTSSPPSSSSPPPPTSPPPFPPAPPSRQPNFVVILVDDQDYLLNSTHRAFMPKLHRYIGDQGLHLNNFIATSSLCCPSRVSLLTGRYTHNHNVTSNQAPQGGWGKFNSLKLDSDWLPTWLKPLGYNTYFTGKFINLFDVQPGDTKSCPKGWDMFDPLTDKTVYDYINYDFMPQCARLDSFRSAYQTDTITERATSYIETLAAAGKPFYLQINPAACHTACPKGAEEGGSCVPPVPAPKYVGRFSNVNAPRLSNWDVPLPNALNIGADEAMNARGIDRHYQRRLETMLSIDDLIESVVTKLEQQGVLNNTYVIYVSDNGYHLGNHGLSKGKTLPYEEDVRVPFYMRGPGVPAGVVSPYMATMVDLTSTLVQLGGGSPPDRLDGIPLPLDRILPGAVPRANFPTTTGTLRQMLPLEMWINSLSKGLDKKDYRSVRVCTSYTLNASLATTCWKYTIWCVWPTTTNYKELFELSSDPGELNNVLLNLDSNPNAPNLRRLVGRLDALLQSVGYCKGPSCKKPWARIHPDGSVDSLEAAMNPAYDAKYESYTKYAWKSCQAYYDPVNNELADPRLGGVSRWWVNTTTTTSAATSSG